MKRTSIIGLFLAAVFALSAGAASSASAADLLAQLPGGGSVVGVTFLSTAGLAQLIRHNGEEIDCQSVTNHGKFLTSTLGDVLIRFSSCTAKGFKCNTAGAATGEIHLPLTTLFHLGLAHLILSGGTVHRLPAIVILPGTVKIECGVPPFTAKIEVSGNVIGALQKANGEPIALNEPRTNINLNFQQLANGLQHLMLILLPGSTTPTSFDLKSNLNGGAFELSSEVVNVSLDGFTTSGGAATSIELVEP